MELKLSFKPSALGISKQNVWLDCFKSAVREMDISTLETLFLDDKVIDGGTKWEFLCVVRDRFQLFKSLGHQSLEQKREICIFCKRGCEVLFFEAEKGQGIGFYLEESEGEVKDILICNGSTGVLSNHSDKLHWYNTYGYQGS